MKRFNLMLNLSLSICIRRPSAGLWTLVEKDATWRDFEECEARAMRCLWVGLERCWVVAEQNLAGTAEQLAAELFNAATEKTMTYPIFRLYLTNPRLPGSADTSALLGNGKGEPGHLWKVYLEALDKRPH